jgi:ankyrin repeat protein
MKQWASEGVRVHTGEALCQAAAWGEIESVRCLVKDLDADVNLINADGCTPLSMAAQEGRTAVARCLVKELGADVDKTTQADAAPLYIAAQQGHLEVSCCLVNELGADVNKANQVGFTPLLVAIYNGHLHMVRCLVEDLQANINKATHDGRTPLMMASYRKHAKIVHLLTKRGADSQVRAPEYGTAANVSRQAGAPAELTEYLEAKMHCSNPGCSGAGIRKCTGCKQARYCEQACQLAHWPTHKAACKTLQAKDSKGQ